jgi:hypothetical protein
MRLGDAGVDSVPVRLCAPTCKADFCGELGTATACIVTGGDVACPTGFNQRTLVASGAAATCGTCACAAPTAKCTGTVHVDEFGSGCGTDKWDMPADGTCNPGPSNTSGTNSSYGSVWETTALPKTPYCASQTDPGGDAGPVGVKTLCCP